MKYQIIPWLDGQFAVAIFPPQQRTRDIYVEHYTGEPVNAICVEFFCEAWEVGQIMGGN